MKSNMGSADRIIRVLIAVAVAVAYFNGLITGTFGIVAMIIAIVLVITALLGFCPLYLPFGISTKPHKKTAA